VGFALCDFSKNTECISSISLCRCVASVPFARYSPDLNPLDYFVWQEVESRMQKNAPPGVESVDSFKKRLRRTALAVPEFVIRKGVADLTPRVQWCAANGGLDIPWD
jgi:hypothetical protein